MYNVIYLLEDRGVVAVGDSIPVGVHLPRGAAVATATCMQVTPGTCTVYNTSTSIYVACLSVTI